MKLKFKNVTAERNDVTKIVESSLGDTPQVQVFENGNTSIIYTTSGNTTHASLSNPTGKIKKSEVQYAIQKIMKTKADKVKVFATSKGIVHITT